MSKNTVVIFSMWSIDFPTPIAHRLEKMINSLHESGMEVILVSYYKGNRKAENVTKHYALERAFPCLKKITGQRKSPVSISDVKQETGSSFFAKLKRLPAAILRSVFAPDIHIIVALPASFLLIWAIIRHKPKYVLSMTNYASFAFMGSIVGKLFNKKIITDLGDLWYVIKEPRLHFEFERKLHQWLEKSTVKRSDLVTCIYPEMMDIFYEQYPELTYKIKPLETGYDSAYVSRALSKKRDINTLTIGYFGTLRMTEQYVTFLPFMETLEVLLKEQPEYKQKIKVLLAGHITDDYWTEMRKLNISDNWEYLGYLEPGEMEEKMGLCDAFIVVTGTKKIPYSFLVPQKIFMYMPFEKPIIYVGIAGKQIDRIKSFFRGIYPFLPEQSTAMKNCLKEMAETDVEAKITDEAAFKELNFKNQFNAVFKDYFKSA